MSSKRDTITTAYTATFIANNDKFPSLSHREHCAVSSNQIEKIGLTLGQQVRILRTTADGTKLALYTIKNVHDDGEYWKTLYLWAMKIKMIFGSASVQLYKYY